MNIAIIGTGWIAEKMAEAVNGLDDNYTAYAVGSRTAEKAEAFAEKWGFEKAYGSYEEMLKDDGIDLVYIATPHSHHYENAKMCIEAGRNMLVEKAFTANAAQAEEIIRLAREKGLLITEAIWTRYMPSRRIIDEIIKSGIIGTPHMVCADLCYPMSHKERIIKPELAGGALLDIGVYTLNFASMVLGDDIEALSGQCTKFPSGTDSQNSVSVTYKNGSIANLCSSALTPGSRNGTVFCSDGYLIAENINNPEVIRVFSTEHELIKEVSPPKQINGYEYQVIECREAIENGWTECPSMPHSETVEIMKQMDTLRNLWGIRYPFE